MPECEIKLVAPYNYDLSLKILSRSKFEIIDRAAPHLLERIVSFDGHPVLTRVQFSGTADNPRAVLDWKILDNNVINKITIIEQVSRTLSAGLDLKPFYHLAKQDKKFRQLIDIQYGLKPILTPTPFEAAAWAIIGQQVNLNFAYTIKKRLVEKYGDKFEIDGKDYYAFPLPRKLSRVKVESLRKMQFSTRKAEYLIGLSKLIVQEPDFLDSLHEIKYENAVERLTAIRGIGIWSANYILMRGAGHQNGLPLGDSGLSRAIQLFYGIDARPDNETVKEYAAPYSPYRGLYTLYLWYYLMKPEDSKNEE